MSRESIFGDLRRLWTISVFDILHILFYLPLFPTANITITLSDDLNLFTSKEV